MTKCFVIPQNSVDGNHFGTQSFLWGLNQTKCVKSKNIGNWNMNLSWNRSIYKDNSEKK